MPLDGQRIKIFSEDLGLIDSGTLRSIADAWRKVQMAYVYTV